MFRLLESLLGAVANLLGMTVMVAFRTAQGYLELLWHMTKRFAFYCLLWSGLYTAGVALKMPALIAVAWGGAALTALAYLVVGIPILWLVQKGHEHLSIGVKLAYAMFVALISAPVFGYFLHKTDAFALPGFFWPASLTALIAILWLVFYGTFRTVLVALTLAVLVPSGLIVAAYRFAAYGSIKTERWALQTTRPARIEYRGGQLECFDPVKKSTPLCWYRRDAEGGYVLYDAPGSDPETGQELIAVTADDVAAVKKRWLQEQDAEQARLLELRRLAPPSPPPSPAAVVVRTPVAPDEPTPPVRKPRRGYRTGSRQSH